MYKPEAPNEHLQDIADWNLTGPRSCSRCRHHKIKCSGDCPCSTCIQRKAKCEFETEESKIQITRKRLSELNRRNRELMKENIALQQRLSDNIHSSATPGHSPVQNSSIDQASAHSEGPSPTNRFIQAGEGNEDENTSMVNPLSSGPPTYITDMAGKPHYLGHTSTWSLTMRLLHLTHQALYESPFPSTAHHIDSMTYDIQWDGLRSYAIPDVRGLPSLDHAIYLINAAKFHTGQMFHLFDEATFLASLNRFYENPAENIHTAGLWLTHFLAIIALGKAVVGAKNPGNTPPGAEFFRTAFMTLPDYSFLWKDPCTSAEILCAFALYLQSIDWRTSAHNMVGQALRILLVHGYHTDVSFRFTHMQDLLRRQNTWWTVYVLERRISVLLGVPLGISDNDISASLPIYPESPFRTSTMSLHVKLSQAFSQVVNALYSEGGSLGSTFVKRAQDVLQRVANVASDLREHFPVPEQEAMNGISRVSGYMNLFYHQCIMLATRPFLFVVVEMCARSDDPQVEVPMPVKLLLQISLESAKKSLLILSALQAQSLLECFLPFDLESAVSAGLVIAMASLVCPSLIENHAGFLRILHSVLDQMVDQGNLIAAGQKKELTQLESLCESLKTSSNVANCPGLSQRQEGMPSEAEIVPPHLEANRDPFVTRAGIEAGNLGAPRAGEANELSDWVQDMSPSQLLEAVDMLNGADLLNWVDIPGGFLEFGNESGG